MQAKRKLKEGKGRRQNVQNNWIQCRKRSMWRQLRENRVKMCRWFGQQHGKEEKDKPGQSEKMPPPHDDSGSEGKDSDDNPPFEPTDVDGNDDDKDERGQDFPLTPDAIHDSSDNNKSSGDNDSHNSVLKGPK